MFRITSLAYGVPKHTARVVFYNLAASRVFIIPLQISPSGWNISASLEEKSPCLAANICFLTAFPHCHHSSSPSFPSFAPIAVQIVGSMLNSFLGNRSSLHGTDLCWKKVSRALQTVYLSWMVNRCSSCWPKVRPWTLMLGGRISATHCRELSAGDLHEPRSDIHTSKEPL